jgi:hypothetical protein
MSPADLKIGTRVIDITNGQSGTIEAKFKSANPNVESDLIAIRVAGNAIVWSHASSLENV